MGDDDPFFCENCDVDLEHDDIETIEPVVQIEPETYDIGHNVAEVYICAGCKEVIGFDLVSE